MFRAVQDSVRLFLQVLLPVAPSDAPGNRASGPLNRLDPRQNQKSRPFLPLSPDSGGLVSCNCLLFLPLHTLQPPLSQL